MPFELQPQSLLAAVAQEITEDLPVDPTFEWSFNSILTLGIITLSIFLVPALYRHLKPDFRTRWAEGESDMRRIGVRGIDFGLAVAIYLYMNMAMVLALDAMGIVDEEAGELSELTLLSAGLITGFSLLIPVLWLILFRFRQFPLIQRFGLRADQAGAGFRWGSLGLLACYPFILLISAATVFMLQALDIPYDRQGPVQDILNAEDPTVLMLLGLGAVILAPITEEILFRGFCQTYLCRGLSAWQGILVTSFLFAAVHMNLASIPPLFVLSVFLGAICVLTRSLWAPIFLHMLFNLSSFLMLVFGEHPEP